MQERKPVEPTIPLDLGRAGASCAAAENDSFGSCDNNRLAVSVPDAAAGNMARGAVGGGWRNECTAAAWLSDGCDDPAVFDDPVDAKRRNDSESVNEV
jgi:hypothetical protein